MPAKARITGFVYFVLDRDAGRVRIGFTSSSPKERMAELQTANPGRLVLSLVLPGTAETHRAITSRFAGCHVGNEWYDASRMAGALFG